MKKAKSGIEPTKQKWNTIINCLSMCVNINNKQVHFSEFH